MFHNEPQIYKVAVRLVIFTKRFGVKHYKALYKYCILLLLLCRIHVILLSIMTPRYLSLSVAVNIGSPTHNRWSNYRAIALSSILNKILDCIILLKAHKSLSSSPLQFGFKKGLSTTQCTHSLLEIVDYYNYNKSDVFVLMLDASKAFDRVRYCKLFNELLERDISPVVLRILIYNVHESNIESAVVPDTN